jgi:hypothetical protein
MSTCEHNSNAPDQTLGTLHEAQEGVQRHKCCECAYRAGYNYGSQYSVPPSGNAECTYKGKRAPKEVIDGLPESQAGKGRHKCAVCAYHEGFEQARREAIASQVGPYVSSTVADALKKPLG